MKRAETNVRERELAVAIGENLAVCRWLCVGGVVWVGRAISARKDHARSGYHRAALVNDCAIDAPSQLIAGCWRAQRSEIWRLRIWGRRHWALRQTEGSRNKNYD